MPDFVITNPYEVCVEAVISKNAFNSKPEYERNPDDKTQLDEIIRTATYSNLYLWWGKPLHRGSRYHEKSENADRCDGENKGVYE